MRVNWLVSKEAVCAEDGFIQCDGNGPHRLSSEQLLKSHLMEAEEARKRETPLAALRSDLDFAWGVEKLNKTTLKLDLARSYSKNRTTLRIDLGLTYNLCSEL